MRITKGLPNVNIASLGNEKLLYYFIPSEDMVWTQEMFSPPCYKTVRVTFIECDVLGPVAQMLLIIISWAYKDLQETLAMGASIS